MHINDIEYKKLSDFIKNNTGIDLGPNKQTLLINRLRGIFMKYNIKSFNDFYKKLISKENPELESELVDAITTNYTYFMRESEHFRYLQDVVLPEITRKNRTYDLRVWCAACSSGQEAYTLAMIIDDFLGNEKFSWDRKLLATDISEKMLDICEKGIYDTSTIVTMPDRWKNNYFRKVNAVKSAVVDDIKNQVIFGKFNLMTEVFPFKKKFNVIFCRNVMIYFDEDTRNKLIKKFYDVLEPGGYLFIGHSEVIERGTSNFKYIMPSVYRKE